MLRVDIINGISSCRVPKYKIQTKNSNRMFDNRHKKEEQNRMALKLQPPDLIGKTFGG